MKISCPLDLTVVAAQGEAMRDFIVDTTLAIAGQRTVNYDPEDYPGVGPDGMDMPGHESRVVEILEPIFDSWGINHYREAKDPNRPTLFASIGKPGGHRLMFLLHTDTVPAGSIEAWSSAPFEPFEKDGKLIGRGVLDNKGPLVAAMAAMKILKGYEDRLKGEVIFVAAPDEEVGQGFGLEYLLDADKVHCDEAIVPDIAGAMREINVAEKGRAVFRIRAHGRAAHAMNPERGVNALFALAAVLQKVESMKMPHKKHPFLGHPTLNLGIARGGNAPNSVADYAEAVIDIRYVPGQKPNAIKRQIKTYCDAEAKRRKGCSFVVELDRNAPPIEVKPSAPIVKAILKHAPLAKIVGTGGGTFAHALVERKIAAVGWAPGDEATYHQPNEEIEIGQLTEYAGKLAALTLERMTTL